VGGEEFSVRPKGNLLHRRNLFTNSKKSIVKMLTVKYQELSELGVPRFPVGKDIRNCE
jgi:DNA ligase-1